MAHIDNRSLSHTNGEIIAETVCVDYVYLSIAIVPKLSIEDFMGYITVQKYMKKQAEKSRKED